MAGIESGRCEQIIRNFFMKVLHAVLDSRVPHLLTGSRLGGDKARKRDRWFNLALGDSPSALENLGFFHRSATDPLVLDVLLLRTDSDSVLERWIVQYTASSSSSSSSSPSSSSPDPAFYKRAYKKCIILLRSVFAILRLLPAYKPFRMLRAENLKNMKNCNFNLSYRVSSFAEPFSRAEEGGLSRHEFPAVETQFGRIAVSVVYRHDLSQFSLESSSLFPPTIIADYVGSLRAVPSSLPPGDGFVLPAAVSRPHSWTSTPMAHHPLSRHGRSFAEHSLSPPFSPSPSPSPSPPTRSASTLQRRLQGETAPVSIPVPTVGGNALHSRSFANWSDPARISLPPPSPRIARADNSSEDSPEIRSFRRVEGFRLSETSPSQLGSFQKGVRDYRDDSGRFSGVPSSCGGSPRVGFSRSSSKLSFQDDLDDSCPFAVDDVDVPDSQRRGTDGRVGPENSVTSSSVSTWTSQEAAVGILVHMLRTAPPLRHDLGRLSRLNSDPCVDQRVDRGIDQGVDGGLGASSFYSSRRAGDAMEELMGYKQIKDMLLSKSGSHATRGKESG
ncbi:autophagy-related protein 13 isoform X2 [Wolffia australiana]